MSDQLAADQQPTGIEFAAREQSPGKQLTAGEQHPPGKQSSGVQLTAGIEFTSGLQLAAGEQFATRANSQWVQFATACAAPATPAGRAQLTAGVGEHRRTCRVAGWPRWWSDRSGARGPRCRSQEGFLALHTLYRLVLLSA